MTAASTGAGLAGIPVCLLPSALWQCIFTEPSGAYSLLGIGAGAHQVGFSLGPANSEEIPRSQAAPATFVSTTMAPRSSRDLEPCR